MEEGKDVAIVVTKERNINSTRSYQPTCCHEGKCSNHEKYNK